MIEQVYRLIREKKQERQENSHRVASEIVAGMIAGSKHWTLQMVSFNLVHLLTNDITRKMVFF